jgi:hypothetical protein
LFLYKLEVVFISYLWRTYENKVKTAYESCLHKFSQTVLHNLC